MKNYFKRQYKKVVGDIKDKSKDAYDSAKSKAGNAYDSAKSKAGDAYDNAKSKAGDAYDNAKSKAGDAYDSAKSDAGYAYSSGKRFSKDYFDDVLRNSKFAKSKSNLGKGQKEIRKILNSNRPTFIDRHAHNIQAGIIALLALSLKGTQLYIQKKEYTLNDTVDKLKQIANLKSTPTDVANKLNSIPVVQDVVSKIKENPPKVPLDKMEGSEVVNYLQTIVPNIGVLAAAITAGVATGTIVKKYGPTIISRFKKDLSNAPLKLPKPAVPEFNQQYGNHQKNILTRSKSQSHPTPRPRQFPPRNVPNVNRKPPIPNWRKK